MNVLCISDGSDDGYETAKTLTGLFDRQLVDKIRIVIVTFPQRESPLWDRAYALWPAEDDLQQAMSVVAQRQLDRLKAACEPHAGSVESEVSAGDPVREVLKSAESLGAGLILLAVTSNEHLRQVHRISSEIVSKSPVPVVVGYGRAEARPNGREKHASSDRSTN